ncbi:VWA domain-containing protein [Niabella sp. CC-SYL272]|uniref:vWA domain-containing protein n=1 Tax=Niabella agricola TaxID=2891571 RepID=UPI001F2334D9|nr:vWA domain-containing protein [Niabella agricola]MCF3109546.1 VWA domain-containing protein [Niabella agricola]
MKKATRYTFIKNPVPAVVMSCFAGLALYLLTSCSKTDACTYTTSEPVAQGCNAGMDVAFLLDYTGSMGPAIDSVKKEVNNIANTIVTESGGDYRLSLSLFDEYTKEGDGFPLPMYLNAPDYLALPASQKKIITSGPTTNQYLTMMEKFAPANKTSFSTQLAKLNNPSAMKLGAGIGGPEPGDLLLHEILSNQFAGTWRNGNITKLAVIITDAPASGDDDNATAADDTYLDALAATANSMGVQCILLTTFKGNATYPANYKLHLITNNTGGKVYEFDSFNNISKELIAIIENICSQTGIRR